MRCSVFSEQVDVSQLEAKCHEVGATDVKIAPRIRQVFCELSPEQVVKLQGYGFKVKEIKFIKTAQIMAPEVEYGVTEVGLNITDIFSEFRSAFTPPLIGTGLTVAVLDSGIRASHEAFEGGKIVYEEVFSEADTPDDVYGHGTSVAYLIAGGIHGDVNTGVAPDAKLLNLKCLNDDGEGTDEMVVAAIDRVCDLVENARASGKSLTDPLYPNVINISLGAEDDGDEDSPVRIACRTAIDEYGLQVLAAAGNTGDKPGTIMLPACDPKVVAVGGLQSDFFVIWEQSSRGPTADGTIKPDFVIYATSIYMADNADDTAYIVKSGTSFSTPMLSGLIGLIWELGRRNFGDLWYVSWYDVEVVGEAVGAKPEGAPFQKDNTYGYGMPAFSAMLRGAMQPAAVTDVVSMMMPLMLLMLVMPMMRGAGGK